MCHEKGSAPAALARVEPEEPSMEVTFYEDPACSWCWAFQPVATAFLFEFRDVLRLRHVMGGLRDRPVADVDFTIQLWKTAEAVSGMPFEPAIWKKHVLRTTFVACRAVKAASITDELAGHRLLRRLREAHHVEQTPIDDLETVLHLAGELGLCKESLDDHLSSGRAEALFARDRAEAAQHGFGFPTILFRGGRHDDPLVLQGAVPYPEILQALHSMGVSPRQRCRFRDCEDGWARLFKIHRRLTAAEIHLVTGIDRNRLEARLEELNLRQCGPFYEPAGPGQRCFFARGLGEEAAAALHQAEPLPVSPSPDSSDPAPPDIS